MTMGSLAADSGVTRQTIHNLFGTKSAVLEALFDVIALDGGMEKMRDIMMQSSPQAMLQGYVEVFCRFWASNRLLIRRIHGIGAIDPEFGAVIQARNHRRFTAALRVVARIGVRGNVEERAAVIAALTSFEFFDALTESLPDEQRVTKTILEIVRNLFVTSPK